MMDSQNLKIEWWPIDRPKPYAKNTRKIPQKAIDLVAKSLREFGWQQAIVCDAADVVIAGHTRLLAARKEGMTHVPVTVAAHLTPAQVRAYRLMDNRSHEETSWDLDILGVELGELKGLDLNLEFTGFNSRELGKFNLDGNPAEAPEAQMDRAEELQAKWHVERGQIWEIGRHRLMCGDSTQRADVVELMRGGDGQHAEMVWTDPPYGVAIGDKNVYLNSIAPSNRVEKNLENDTLDEDGLRIMLEESFANIAEVCTAGAAWYVAAPAGPLHVIFGSVLKDMGIWRQTIQWVKNNATFSPMGVDYHWQAEPIFYGWIPNAGHRYRGDRTQTTVWAIDRPSKSPEHPTMKPIELVARAIRNSSDDGQVVLDAFLGSGSTMVAAEQTGRVCYGLEIEPKYCAVILERMYAMGLTPELTHERTAAM